MGQMGRLFTFGFAFFVHICRQVLRIEPVQQRVRAYFPAHAPSRATARRRLKKYNECAFRLLPPALPCPVAPRPETPARGHTRLFDDLGPYCPDLRLRVANRLLAHRDLLLFELHKARVGRDRLENTV